MLNVTKHIPVMTTEVIEGLQVRQGEWYVDATLGGGGHTKAILGAGGNVLAIDRDVDAISRMNEYLNKHKNEADRVILVSDTYASLAGVLYQNDIREIAGCVFDLGLSSDQLEIPERGFSFMHDGPLDMRMDQRLPVKAQDLVNALEKSELVRLFRIYGDVSNAPRIADYIINARKESLIMTTAELSKVVERAVGKRYSKNIHPATQVFQALRIAVNDELHQLERGLEAAFDAVSKGGRIVVISFHSLEDRIVKNYFNQQSGIKVITKKPITSSQEEVNQNPRSRSAKLRIGERI